MNLIHRVTLFILIIIASTSSFFSQNTLEEQPLAPILKTIENQYDIRFSYIDAILEDKQIVPPPSDISLSEVIIYLQERLDLDFEVINTRFIAIKKREGIGFDIQKLEEVYIDNYLTSGISTQNTGVTRIEPKTFGILPGLIEPDILQTLQALPGISSIDETISNVNIRGGTHDQNLILWDGIKMYQSGHFFGLISAFNPYIVNNVFVSKNGSSAKYGDGVSSIIDIQLDNNLNDSFSGGLGFNLIHGDVIAKIPLLNNKLEMQIAARRAITDVLETPTFDQYFDRIFQDTDITNNRTEVNQTVTTNEAFYFYDVSAKLLYDISEKDKLRLSITAIENALGYTERATTFNTIDALNSEITQNNFATAIHYNRQWSSTFASDLQVYASNYSLDATNFDIINNQRLIQNNEVLDTGIKLDTQYQLQENLQWKNGYQFFEVGVTNVQDVINPVFRSSVKEVLRSHSLYSELTYQSKNKNTLLRSGFRGTYYGEFDTFLLEPRLSYSQRFFRNFRLEVLGEFKSQTTSQIIDGQNDFLGVERRRWILANDDNVPIIKSKQGSLGIHYTKNKWLLSAEAYIKEVRGITSRSQGFQNQFQFVNAIGDYEIRGVDFLINKQFTAINAWLSYSLSKNDYTFNTLNNGRSFPNNVDIRHAITFASTYTYKKITFALGVNWHSGRVTTTPLEGNETTGNAVNFSSPNNSNLNDYFRTDFSSTYTFSIDKKVKGKIGVSIWNLLNRKNELNRRFVAVDDVLSEIENQSLGITPNLSFRISF